MADTSNGNVMVDLLKIYNLATKEEKKKLLQIMKMYERTNEVYLPLYENKDRYLVLMGGGGSGKSIFAGQKVLKRITSKKGHRILVVRKVAKTIRESCFHQLRSQIGEYYNLDDFGINNTDLRIVHKPTGNEIIFSGLDDVEKLKSISGLTSIWIEEASELDREDFHQLDIRLRGKSHFYKQIIFSFNPISVTHWLKSEFFDVKKQDTTTLHTTYKNNRFLDEAAIKVLEGFKDTDPYYYMVYCCGEWGVIGKIVFDGQKVSNRIVQLREDKIGEKGRIEYKNGSYLFEPDVNGLWTVYKHPEPKFKYSMGADVAEGNKWGDYDAAHIIDTSTYEQCAVFHGHVDVDSYAEELIKGGYYFNTALICPEVNFNPGLVLNLERQKYPKLYLRQSGDSITHDIQLKHGFRTDKYNRQSIIGDLIEFVRDHVEKINDIPTLEEMLTFVRNDKGKPEAQEGKHDDLVMGYAIALHAAISGQGGRYHKEEKKVRLRDMPPDIIADYYRASKEDRKILEEKWRLAK